MSESIAELGLVVLAAIMLVWAWSLLYAPRPPGPAFPPRRPRPARDPIDTPAFSRRLMGVARDLATGYPPGRRHPLHYRTPSGMDFGFSLERRHGRTWRIYVHEQPSYRRREPDAHTSHRYRDDDGRHYVCWDGPSERLEQAIFVAVRWAHLTERLILTGRGF